MCCTLRCIWWILPWSRWKCLKQNVVYDVSVWTYKHNIWFFLLLPLLIFCTGVCTGITSHEKNKQPLTFSLLIFLLQDFLFIFSYRFEIVNTSVVTCYNILNLPLMEFWNMIELLENGLISYLMLVTCPWYSSADSSLTCKIRCTTMRIIHLIAPILKCNVEIVQTTTCVHV